MNMTVRIKRRAIAQARLEEAIGTLAKRARVAEPDMEPARYSGAIDFETRQMLELERLADVMARIAKLPVQEPEPEPEPTVAESLATGKITAGWLNNPGQPVLMAPGMEQTTAAGETVAYTTVAAQGYEAVAAGRANARAAVLEERSQAAAADVTESPPPTPEEQIELNEAAMAERSAAAATIHLAEEMGSADIENEGAVPRGFADNPGPPTLSDSGASAVPVDVEDIEADAEANAEIANEHAAELAEAEQEAAQDLQEAGVLDDLLDIVDVPSAESAADAARANAETEPVYGVAPAVADLSFLRPQVIGSMEQTKAQSQPVEPKAPTGIAALRGLGLTDSQREALVAAGIGSRADLRSTSDQQLLSVAGIGDATVKRLRRVLNPPAAPTAEPAEPAAESAA